MEYRTAIYHEQLSHENIEALVRAVRRFLIEQINRSGGGEDVYVSITPGDIVQEVHSLRHAFDDTEKILMPITKAWREGDEEKVLTLLDEAYGNLQGLYDPESVDTEPR